MSCSRPVTVAGSCVRSQPRNWTAVGASEFAGIAAGAERGAVEKPCPRAGAESRAKAATAALVHLRPI